MVGSIDNNGPLTSLLRAQATAPLPSSKAVQTIIQQPQKTAVVTTKTSNITQSSKLAAPRVAGTSSAQILPRGSIVDQLA